MTVLSYVLASWLGWSFFQVHWKSSYYLVLGAETWEPEKKYVGGQRVLNNKRSLLSQPQGKGNWHKQFFLQYRLFTLGRQIFRKDNQLPCGQPNKLLEGFLSGDGLSILVYLFFQVNKYMYYQNKASKHFFFRFYSLISLSQKRKSWVVL